MDNNQSETQRLMAEIESLKAANAALTKAKKPSKGTLLGDKLSVQVAEKSGAVSVYGISRFPVTLYADQWMRLLPVASGIITFIKANEQKIREKTEAKATEKAV